MDALLKQLECFFKSFLSSTTPIIVGIGLVIAVGSMILIGLNFITAKTPEDRSGAILNLKYTVVGIIALFLITPILSYLFSLFITS